MGPSYYINLLFFKFSSPLSSVFDSFIESFIIVQTDIIVMRGEVKREILEVLKRSIVLVKLGKVGDLKKLSDEAVYEASIFQEKDSVSVAVVIYALSKIIERGEIAGNFIKKVSKNLKKCYDLLSNDDYNRYRERMNSIFGLISGFDEKFRVYVQDVLQKSMIKKGSMLYGKGISMAQAARVLNLSQWELMDYAGKVDMPSAKEGVTVDSRMKYVRGLFDL